MIPTNEELMIARHTGVAAGTRRGPRLTRAHDKEYDDGCDRTDTKPDRAADASPWQGFRPGLWQKEINVRDFIQQNYTPYDGDESFLAPATARTQNDLGAS